MIFLSIGFFIFYVGVVLRIGETEDTEKSLQVSATVVFHYLLVTDSSVQPRAGATQWFLREPGGILGNNQYKMCWVAAMLRSMLLDRMVFDGINNT